ncbi:aldo/keto reductase [Nocardia aurantia]|uniref:Pyridoxine 4-dehydrogenase n=1 Tax=Nocardia aurantia TaxID=2585199 RepID=A0A7K0DQN9_9NOCA|nr:aldo/keto reductase [Nocardia aurantia]MQY28096.1 Pyridoxine 4-dehydrogenase [Nocardia aurantia]
MTSDAHVVPSSTGPAGPARESGRADRPGATALLGDRPVARIGFGAMQLVHRRVPPVDPDTAIAVLRRAVEGGVDHIDTAQFYGAGACNRLIHTALAPYDDRLTIVTKIGADNDASGGIVPAQRPEQLRAQIHANLAELRVDRLPVVNLRRADIPPGIIATGDQAVGIDDQLAELISLREEGLIGGIGLSNVAAETLRAALPAGIAGVQNVYNLLNRDTAPVLEVCREHDIAWVPYFPLGSAGFAGWSSVTDDPVVRAAADRLRTTPAGIALAWLLADYDHTLLIPGTADLAHLAGNLAAGDIVLDRNTRAELDALGEPAPAG